MFRALLCLAEIVIPLSPGTAIPFFRKLEGIQAGDRVQFSTVRGTSEYVVESTEIVQPDKTRVMESRGIAELTLISCYPFYSLGAAPHRFIVHALPARCR